MYISQIQVIHDDVAPLGWVCHGIIRAGESIKSSIWCKHTDSLQLALSDIIVVELRGFNIEQFLWILAVELVQHWFGVKGINL